MGNKTKNDLSFGVVKLDEKALKRTAAWAVILLKREIQEHIRKLEDAFDRSYGTGITLEAERLSECSSILEVAADTYATILGISEREEVIIIREEKEVK